MRPALPVSPCQPQSSGRSCSTGCASARTTPSSRPGWLTRSVAGCHCAIRLRCSASLTASPPRWRSCWFARLVPHSGRTPCRAPARSRARRAAGVGEDAAVSVAPRGHRPRARPARSAGRRSRSPSRTPTGCGSPGWPPAGGDVARLAEQALSPRRAHRRRRPGHRRAGPAAGLLRRRLQARLGARASTRCRRSSPGRGRPRSSPPAPPTSSSTGSPAPSACGRRCRRCAAGRTVALANKESLIAGGDLVTAAAAPGQLVPVDSEHSALAQCLRGGARGEVARLVLTASGGPFRGRVGRRARRRHRRRRRWPTRPGTWARSSRSTPRPWSTRASS